jgi:hypothetical protein
MIRIRSTKVTLTYLFFLELSAWYSAPQEGDASCLSRKSDVGFRARLIGIWIPGRQSWTIFESWWTGILMFFEAPKCRRSKSIGIQCFDATNDSARA